jgi:hypothetical protein
VLADVDEATGDERLSSSFLRGVAAKEPRGP